MFSDQIDAASPYRVLLARAIASSGVRKVVAVATGPKISTSQTVDAGSTSVKKPGAKIAALGREFHGCLPQRAALNLALLDQRGDAFQLSCRDKRTDIHGLVERIADPQRFHALAQLVVEPLRDAFLHEDARSGTADFALVEPDGVDNAFHRPVHVGIFEDDERRLAAELQRQLLLRSGNLFADDAADFGRAGKGNLVDIVMAADQSARFAIAMDDIDNTGRQANFMANFGKGDCRQRRQFRRLEHDRITRCKCRGDLPCQHQQREIPRDHLSADTDRREAFELGLDHLGPAGMMVKMPGNKRDIDVTRLADRLAIVHGLEDREEALTLLDMTRDGIEIFGALMSRQFGPLAEGAACGLDRRVDILGRTLRDLGQHGVVGRIDHGKGLAAFDAGELAVDEMAEPLGVDLKPVLNVSVALRSGAIFHGAKDVLDLSHDLFPQASAWREDAA